MSSTGFLLTRLTLTGPGVPVAEVHFGAGLNVVFGASNTGKTFIAQCVDYACGAGDRPKEIPEAASYDNVLLGLRLRDGEGEMVLERSLRGGDISMRMGEGVSRTLGAKHHPERQDTVSHFLLDLAALAGKKVRMNQQGKTRLLSFRDISRVVFVDEESVISERSPIFSGQFAKRTEESAIFRLLLTGVDDSSVIAKNDPKIAKGRQEGKAEIIEELLGRARAQMGEQEFIGNEPALREKLDHIEALFGQTSLALAAEQESVALIEGRRRGAWERLRQVESRRDVLSELQRRFELLQEQYSSDQRRLEAISEAGVRLGQMREERCPVCGALAEHHDLSHREAHAAPEEVANACRAEALKIQTLLADLQSTIVDNEREISRLGEEHRVKKAELEAAGVEIRERLQPRLQAALQAFRESQLQRDACHRAVELHERVAELERALTEVERAPTKERADGPPTRVGADEAEQFSKEVEALLRAWQLPNLGRVTFSEEDQDVIISGQRRASHGKGVRAITHAAFNLAIMRYCLARRKAHPGVVLIDSPLIVYRQPDQGEGNFSRDVKDAFYRSLAVTFSDSQVIILENDPPPTDLGLTVNIIEFTGTEQGRFGFIPKQQADGQVGRRIRD
jgi:hypothetical protein